MERESEERVRPPGNLPLQASSFVGREQELSEVRSLLDSGRLLTLTGPGGCGKTRLALRVADDVDGDYRDGVFWVELAALSDAGLVPEAVARTLGLRWGAGISPTEELANHLRDGEALLVLDNCEHLVAACAGLAEILLGSCPGLKILATSREGLRVPGERAWPVPSLPLPAPGNTPDPEEISRYGAVRLFVERAAAVVPGFALGSENAGAVARICERLDGIPLAIELAAARVKVLSLAQISARLDDRFLLLTGGSRVLLPRQRTLKAAIDWSHELLSEEEQVVFRRFAAFAGGFSLEAAEAVCPGGAVERDEVLDLLSRLVDKSLVLVARRDGEVRYRMLETVLQYAAERLEESGEKDPVRDRHADFFLRLAERAEPEISGAEQRTWMDRLDAEMGNLRSTMAWFGEAGRTEEALRLATALWAFCHARGHYDEGRLWLEGAISKGGPPSLLAGALAGAGIFALLQCEYGRATELLEESLALYDDLDERRGIAEVKDVLGGLARELGDYERAETLHEEALVLWRAFGDESGAAESMDYLGFVAWLRGDHDRALVLCERSLGMHRAAGDTRGILSSLINLGSAALYVGDHDRAQGMLEEAYALSKEGNYVEGIGWSSNQLGLLAHRRGDHARAEILLHESLGVHRDLNDLWRAASVLELLAQTAVSQGHPGRAARLFGGAAALRERTGTPPPPCERPDLDRSVAAVRANLGEEAFAEARAAGAAMTLEGVFDYALSPEREAATSSVGPTSGLSLREIEVLGLAAEGLTDTEVADKLYLSPRTVSQHLRNVYRKLGVKSRTAATRAAIERGLL